MAKIANGFGLTVAILASLNFAIGIVISILAYLLAKKSPAAITFERYNDHTNNDFSDVDVAFFKYTWWSLTTFALPGLFGIIAGCCRKISVMAIFLVMTMLVLVGSIIIGGIASILTVNWSMINDILHKDYCSTKHGDCSCKDYDNDNYFKLENVSCGSVMNYEMIMIVFLLVLSLHVLISLISSYVACCSFCNKEEERESKRNIIFVPNTYGSTQGAVDPEVLKSNIPRANYAPPPPPYNYISVTQKPDCYEQEATCPVDPSTTSQQPRRYKNGYESFN